MPLTHLELGYTEVSDLSPLSRLPLQNLGLWNTRVSDISPLAEFGAFTRLVLNGCPVSDLKPLEKVSVRNLLLAHTPITDISSLRMERILILRLDGCDKLNDLTPLAGCRDLETLIIPAHCENIDFLRSLPSLKFLGSYYPPQGLPAIPKAAEFWKRYDAQKGKTRIQ